MPKKKPEQPAKKAAPKKPRAKPKKTVGRKCTVCSHKQVAEINTAIGNEQSLRSIAVQYGIRSHSNVVRHTENCLKVELKAVVLQRKVAQAIDVHEEFRQQLAFAKKLRLAAEDYLSDPIDPLKLILIPRVDEIEVVYYDYGDMTGGDNPQPKKKTSELHSLLAGLALDPDIDIQDDAIMERSREKLVDTDDPDEMFKRTWEAARQYFMRERQSMDRHFDKVSIKHVDLRKFALDAIHTTDATIDKFAKLAGLYQKDQENQNEVSQLIQQIRRRAEELKIPFHQEVQNYLDTFGADLRGDIKEELVSHLTH